MMMMMRVGIVYGRYGKIQCPENVARIIASDFILEPHPEGQIQIKGAWVSMLLLLVVVVVVAAAVVVVVVVVVVVIVHELLKNRRKQPTPPDAPVFFLFFLYFAY